MTNAPKAGPARPAPSSTALRRAIEVAGSELKLAEAINVHANVLSWWLHSQGSPAAYACVRIEDCTGVSCEELRPDLHWVRLGYEVVGHIVPVDGATGAYVEKALRAAYAANPDVIRRAMIDGMLYGLDGAKKRELLDFYRADEPGVKVDLNSLLHDLYFERQDAKYYQAWSIMYALEDHVREDLMKRHPVFQTTRTVTDDELGRLQQEVDALRWMTGELMEPIRGDGTN